MRFVVNLLVVASLIVQPAIAHSPPDASAPVSMVPGLAGAISMNRAGYGYLNATSESEADAVFMHQCPRPGQTLSSVCLGTGSELLSALQHTDNNLDVAMTSLMRQKVFEYISLQRSAGGTATAVSDIPSCLIEDQAGEDSSVGSTATATTLGRIGFLSKKTDDQLDAYILAQTTALARARAEAHPNQSRIQNLESQRLLALKLRSTRASMDNERMGQAFLLNKQLKHHEDIACASATTSNQLKCLNIRRKRDRIRFAFPSIFPYGVETEMFVEGSEVGQALEALNPTAVMGCTPTATGRLESAIYRLVGANGAAPAPAGTNFTPAPVPNPLPAGCTADPTQSSITRGQGIIDGFVSNASGYPSLVTTADEDGDGAFDGVFTEAMSQGRGSLVEMEVCTDPDDPATCTMETDRRMQAAYNEYDNSIAEVKDQYIRSLRRDSDRLCDMSLRRMATKYPHVLRQMVLDNSDEGTKESMRRFLCQNNMMGRFQRTQAFSCLGVSGALDQPTGVRVQRPSWGFPYSSDVDYTVTRNPDGSYNVSTTINYNFTYDASVDPSSAQYAGNATIPVGLRKTQAQQQAEFNTTIANWQTQANTYFQQNASAITDPRVTYNIQAGTGNSEPLVNVSPCYRAGGAPATFATDFPGEVWNSHNCRHVLRYGNWRDAGNYTLNTPQGTVMHETGHAMGLADEYNADYYPAHALGEDGSTTGGVESIMNNSHAANHSLFPRHVREMIIPATNCGGPAPAGPDRP